MIAAAMRNCVVAAVLLASAANTMPQAQSSTPSLLRKRRSLADVHQYYARSLAEADGPFEYDPTMDDFMKKRQIKKMMTQNMVDETLILNDEKISFADEHLAQVNVFSNGAKSNVFYVLDSGREYTTEADNVIRVLKRDGVVKRVTMRVKDTNERINAELMKDGITYAIFSTVDLDDEELSKFNIDSLMPPDDGRPPKSRNIHRYGTGPGRQRGLQDANGCTEYKVIRMHAMYDSHFCDEYGGTDQAVQDVISSIIADVSDYYESSPGLCQKVEVCQVSGSCDLATDDLRSVIDTSTEFCSGASTSLIVQYRDYVYPSGTSHSSQYPSGDCDTTHLFFGGGTNPFSGGGTIGCAYVGTLCNSAAVGANNVGRYTANPAAQAVLLAHELGELPLLPALVDV